MNRINPACKFFGILVPTILLALFYRPVLNLAVFFACIVLLLISRAGIKTIAKALTPVFIVAIGMFFTGYRFHSGAALGISRLIFTNTAVYNGLQLSSRVLAFAGMGMLFVLTTDKLELVRSLHQQCRLPARFAFGLLAAWGMFPNMRREYHKTRAAFYARGLRSFALSPAMLTPLLVKAVRWSEALSVAMESKGLGETETRTTYFVLKIRPMDVAFPILTCALLAMGLLLPI